MIPDALLEQRILHQYLGNVGNRCIKVEYLADLLHYRKQVLRINAVKC